MCNEAMEQTIDCRGPPQGGSGVPKPERHTDQAMLSEKPEWKELIEKYINQQLNYQETEEPDQPPEDNWSNRSEEMRCLSCMHYLNYRCRRHSPTLNGFPAVYPTDWCGDHKLDKSRMQRWCGL